MDHTIELANAQYRKDRQHTLCTYQEKIIELRQPDEYTGAINLKTFFCSLGLQSESVSYDKNFDN